MHRVFSMFDKLKARRCEIKLLNWIFALAKIVIMEL